jgi:hypothetical protein
LGLKINRAQISNQYSDRAKSSEPQPNKKQIPPIGVMAPSHFQPVKASKYNVPEKIKIPSKKLIRAPLALNLD